MISFKSAVTTKLLDYYFINQEASQYINGLAKLLDLDPKNVDRKLKELEKEGLLASEFRGKERYFSLNKQFPLLTQYRQIFLRTYGLEQKLKEIVAGIPKIKEAYIFGSYAKDKMDAKSDLDILAIGSHSALLLQRQISALQKKLGREINVVNLSVKEFAAKKEGNDPFIANILASRLIKLL